MPPTGNEDKAVGAPRSAPGVATAWRRALRQRPGPQSTNFLQNKRDVRLGRKAPDQAGPEGPRSKEGPGRSRAQGASSTLAAPAASSTGGRHGLAQATAGHHTTFGELVPT